jgi:hypothetical protein
MRLSQLNPLGFGDATFGVYITQRMSEALFPNVLKGVRVINSFGCPTASYIQQV